MKKKDDAIQLLWIGNIKLKSIIRQVFQSKAIGNNKI